MNTTAITISQQAALEQVLAAGISLEQLAMFAAQQQQNRSGAESDSDMVELWLKTRGKGKLRTMRAYAGDVSEFFSWLGGRNLTTVLLTAKIHGEQVQEELRFVTGGKGIRALTAMDLQRYKDALAQSGHRPATQTRKLSSVRSLLSYSQVTGFSQFNVGAAVKPASSPKKRKLDRSRLLTAEEVIRMIAFTEKPRDRMLLRFLHATGARVGEALLLKWSDVDFQPGCAVVHIYGEKTDEVRQVSLKEGKHPELLALLRKFREQASSEREFVFKSQKGGALDASQAFRIVRAAAQRAGIEKDVSPHWLRHAHGTAAARNHAPVHLIADTLGHQSIETTMMYLDVAPGETSADYL